MYDGSQVDGSELSVPVDPAQIESDANTALKNHNLASVSIRNIELPFNLAEHQA